MLEKGSFAKPTRLSHATSQWLREEHRGQLNGRWLSDLCVRRQRLDESDAKLGSNGPLQRRCLNTEDGEF